METHLTVAISSPEERGIAVPVKPQQKEAGYYPLELLEFKELLMEKLEETDRAINDIRRKISCEADGHEKGFFGVHAEAGSAEEELEKDARLLTRLGDFWWQIQKSLRKISFGTYGICDCGCGQTIPRARLLSNPVANQRIECKQKITEEAKMRFVKTGAR